MQGVYQIRNKINDKRYIGSSKDVESRWNTHRKELQEGNHHNMYFQRAWNKYEEGDFVFEIREEVTGDQKALLDAEQIYLDKGFNSGILYNIARRAGKWRIGLANYCKIHGHSKSMLGKHHTQETKDNLSKQLKEWHRTHDHPRGMLGKRHSEESCSAISKANGEPYPSFYNPEANEYIPEGCNLSQMCLVRGLNYMSLLNLKQGITRQSCDGWMLAEKECGGDLTEETRAKLSKADSGKSLSKRGKTGKDHYQYGRPRTEETKSKIRERLQGTRPSDRAVAAAIKANARPYPAFYNIKTGEFILAGFNLRKLCQERNLTYDGLLFLKSGHTKLSIDGWRLATESEIKWEYKL